jgi:hypothetical protein
MEARIAEVAETTKLIAPFPQETVEAIAAGAQSTAAAVQESIEFRAAASFSLGQSLYRNYPRVLIEPNYINRRYS